MDTPTVILTQVSSREEAERIGETLVREYLAAGVNIVPGIVSIYRWQGKIERAEECMLVIKTKRSTVDQALDRLASLHSYEAPAGLVLPVTGGLKPYLDWIASSVEDGWHELG